jgi:hypothetical protein
MGRIRNRRKEGKRVGRRKRGLRESQKAKKGREVGEHEGALSVFFFLRSIEERPDGADWS